MKLIDLYLQEVKSNLYMENKKAILVEISDTIYEQLEGDLSIENVSSVLNQMGDPRLVANNYNTTKKYLIGPDIFDSYLYALILGSKLAFIISLLIVLMLSVTTTFASIFVAGVQPLLAINTVLQIIIDWQLFSLVGMTILYVVFERLDNPQEYIQSVEDINFENAKKLLLKAIGKIDEAAQNAESKEKTYETGFSETDFEENSNQYQYQYRRKTSIFGFIIKVIGAALIIAFYSFQLNIPDAGINNQYILNQDLRTVIVYYLAILLIFNFLILIFKLIYGRMNMPVTIVDYIKDCFELIAFTTLTLTYGLFPIFTNFLNANYPTLDKQLILQIMIGVGLVINTIVMTKNIIYLGNKNSRNN